MTAKKCLYNNSVQICSQTSIDLVHSVCVLKHIEVCYPFHLKFDKTLAHPSNAIFILYECIFIAFDPLIDCIHFFSFPPCD